MERKTYGQIVQELKDAGHVGRGKNRINASEEEILARVWGRIPWREQDAIAKKTTIGWLRGRSELKGSADIVERCVAMLRSHDLASSGHRIHKKVHTYTREEDSYDYIAAELATRWAAESPHDYIGPNRFCQRLKTNGLNRGRWGAPDITILGGRTLPFLPGKFLDVVTFEVKKELDVSGLYEAMSQRTKSSATHAYLFCDLNGKEADAEEREWIRREAMRTGIGFILAPLADDYSTWEEIVPAARCTPDPIMLHDFIMAIWRSKTKHIENRNALRRLRDWLRSDPFLGDRPYVDFKKLGTKLGLDEDDQKIAEDIYLEIPLNPEDHPMGWKHFEGWIDRTRVEEIREILKREGVIKGVQGGGMRLPSAAD